MSERVIGIDIGATKIAVGLVDRSGGIEGTERLATAAFPDGEAAVAAILRACRPLVTSGGVIGVGVGCTGPLDRTHGTVQNDYTLKGWKGVPLVARLSEALELPVAFENDADAALLGETLFGSARGAESVVMLTFGSGVGSAVMIGGELLRGPAGEHPEVGHIRVAERGRTCYCGLDDCLESWTSGRGLERTLSEAGEKKDLFGLSERYQEGDPSARRVVEHFADDVAAGAATLVACYLPQILVFGGGVMESFFSAVKPAVEERIGRLEFGPATVEVTRPALSREAGIVGAAAALFRRRTNPHD